MKAILAGGPANGQLINHPKMMIYRHIIPKPLDLLTIQNTLQAAIDQTISKPNYDIADYEFTGQAQVNLQGEVVFVVYSFKGMEP